MNINKFLNKDGWKKHVKLSSISGNRDGYFKITKGYGNESPIHRDTKYKVCCELAKKNYEFYTEVEFKNYGRCDILAADPFGNIFIIEILKSEEFNPTYTEYKRKNYPQEFEFITIKCGEEIKLSI